VAQVEQEESDDDDDVEVKEDHKLETITTERLQGKWKHSSDFFLTVRKSRVKCKTGQKYKLVEVGNTVELVGDSTPWKAVPSKSSAQKIHWESAEDGAYGVQWHFEGVLKNKAEEAQDDDDQLEDDVEIDKSLILDTKRRRNKVDYVRLDKKLGKDPAAGDIALPGDKVLMAPPPGSLKRKSATSEARARIEQDRKRSRDGGEADERPKKKREMKVLSTAELEQLFKQLDGKIESIAPKDALMALSKLMYHPMDIPTLKATKLGVAVNPYRKHPDDKVGRYAKEVVKRWKNLLNA